MTARSALTLLAAGAAALAPPARAQDAAPVGIEACDGFLAAYERCAASPGVPEVARPGLLQTIAGQRTAWREAVARDERARRTVTYQCAQSHAAVRPRLIEAFGCDFPAPDAASAAMAREAPPGRVR